jgi:patatin-like phospholipase/acyl hydrolase
MIELGLTILHMFVGDQKYNTMDALLSDICISTSAAPTYLPAYSTSRQKISMGTPRSSILLMEE